MARLNRIKIIILFLLIWFLIVDQAQAAPIQGVNEFLCRPNNPHLSRAATGSNTRLEENNQLIIESEVESKLNILVKGQTNNSKQLKDIRDDLQKGFIGLGIRNQELLEINQKLEEQLEIITIVLTR